MGGSNSEKNVNTSTSFFVSTALAGASSGSVAKLLFHPIDTIKAKMQVERATILKASDFTKRNSFLSTIKGVLAKEGIRGFYPGAAISALGSAPANCLYFTVYEFSKNRLQNSKVFENRDSLMYLTSGMIAEIVSCVLWLPIDVVKERLQVQSNLKAYSYKNTSDAIKTIMKYEGVRGLYKAYGATVLSFGPFSALYFFFYENLKKIIAKNSQNISFYESMGLSAISGALASMITNPLDMTKLRMQVQRGENAMNANKTGLFNYKNIFHGMYYIGKTEGFLSLYKGSWARVAHSTPLTAVSMSLMETFRQFFVNYTSFLDG